NLGRVRRRGDPAVDQRYGALGLRSGVVGSGLPLLHGTIVPVMRGHTLIFGTDGIRREFTQGLALGDGPQQLADKILGRHAKRTDDALVLVARYVGEAS